MLRSVIWATLLSLNMQCLAGSSGTKSSAKKTRPIARVHNQYLYASDLAAAIHTTHPVDSLAQAERYVQSWVEKQLIMGKAHQEKTYDKAYIEQRVLDYRYELVVHSHIQKWVEDHLDTTVSEAEMEAYYTAHQDNFKLKNAIFQGQCIVLPKNAPNQARLRTLLTSQRERDQADLKVYCCQFATEYVLDDAVWLSWDDIMRKTPFAHWKDSRKDPAKTKLIQMQDDTYFYYLKIKAYKPADNTAPFDYVKDQVRDMIIHRRKIALADQVKQHILEEAKPDKDYVIYDEKFHFSQDSTHCSANS
ncbi:MAG: peptidylprolyl isomerase [Bacteroidota bacterium]